jgi:uncharacterized protein (TIGR02246 family)
VTIALNTPEAIVDGFIDAWNRHDMDAYAVLFTPDSHFVNIVGHWWKRRQDNVDHHIETHGADGVHGKSTMEAEAVETIPLADGVAVVVFQWALTGVRGPDGTPVPDRRRGTLMFTVIDTGDGWRIRATSNTPLRTG